MAQAQPDGGRKTPGPKDRLRLTQKERRAWLRLIRTDNVGPATFRDLLDHFGSAELALEALPELSSRGGRPVRVFPEEDAEAELERAERLGARLVAPGESGYPPWLARIDAPPPLVYVKGVLALAAKPIIAIVGARNGSAVGRKFTRLIAGDLGNAGYVIASGLARGIDTAAHEAALPTGTIAVVAGGIDIIYPPENADLQSDIGARGLLLSERPPSLQPRGKDFPRRNRLISGMSAGVVVVEAAQRSGSLITARFAGEQGREVFAVPGHPLDPRAAGTNRLLKDGACLIETAEDIISVLAPIVGRLMVPVPSPGGTVQEPAEAKDAVRGDEFGDADRRRVIAALSYSPIDIDEVVRSTALPAGMVHVVLLELDLAGRLQRHGRQLISLRPSEA